MGEATDTPNGGPRDIDRIIEGLLEKPFSRRSFMAIAAGVGLAVTLPIGGGRFMHAWADEAGNQDYVVFVLNRWEVGICLFDVSSGLVAKAVPGAKVAITSLCNKAVVVGMTDQYGVAILDVRDLAEPDSAGDKRETYQFWGSVLAEKEGYRIYETGKQRITTPFPVDAATQPLDGKAYAQCITFNGYDIQYAKDAEFVMTKDNDYSHELIVKINAGKNRKVGVAIRNNGIEKGRIASLSTGGSGIARAAFTGQWLLAKGNGFPVGSRTTVSFWLDSQPETTVTTKLSVVEGCIDTSLNSTDGTAALDLSGIRRAGDSSPNDPAFAAGTWIDFLTLPNALPKMGGSKFSALIPSFPVRFEFNPFGKALIGLGFDGSFFKGEDGKPAWEGWKSNTSQSAKDQFKQTTDRWQKALDDLVARGSQQSGISSTGVSKPVIGFNVNVMGAVMLGMEWGFVGARYWKGTLQGYVKLLLDLIVTEQMYIEGFPVYIGFDFSLAAAASFSMALKTVGTGLEGLEDTANGAGIILDANITGGVSAGIGVSGLVSIGVRGFAYLKSYVALTDTKSPYPHVVVGAGAGVQIAAQVLLFKVSLSIYGHEWPKLYDNWDETFGSDAGVALPHNEAFSVSDGRGGRALSLPYSIGTGNDLSSVEDLVDLATVVTNTQLGATRELVATPNNEGGFLYTIGSGGGVGTGVRCLPVFSGTHELGVPVQEHLIYENIFSDPRIRVLVIEGRVLMFRIATVEYPGGENRTRLTYAEQANGVWGIPQPIEYELEVDSQDNPQGVTRLDIYDYEFDIIQRWDGARWQDGSIARICVTGGTRPQGDSTTLPDAAAHTVLTFLTLNVSMQVRNKHTFMDCFKKDQGANDQMLLFPRLCSPSHFAQDPEMTFIFAFLRTAPKGGLFTEGLFSDEAAIAGFSPLGVKAVDLTSVSIGENARDIKQDVVLGLTAILKDYYSFSFSYTCHDKGTGMATLKSFCTATHYQFSKFGMLELRDSAAFNDIVSVKPWRTIGYLLCKQGKDPATAKLVSIRYGSGEGFVLEPMSPPGFGIDQFDVSDDGQVLYYSTNREGHLPYDISEDGSFIDKGEIKQYQIYASRLVKTATAPYWSYYDPFPFAYLEHPADQLAHCRSGKEIEFVYSSITNMETSAANVYHCAVPLITCVTLLGFASIHTFVCKGEEADFLVTARNDGNTVISEFILVIKTDEGFHQEAVVNRGVRYSALATEYASMDGLVGADDIGALAEASDHFLNPMVSDIPEAENVCIPGKEKMYRLTLKVPDVWKGSQVLQVGIKEESIKVSDHPNFYEDDFVRENAFFVASRYNEEPTQSTVLLHEIGVDLSDIDVTASSYADGDGQKPADDSEGAGKAGGKSRLPASGDAASALSTAAAVAAGVGAAGTIASRLLEGRERREEH